MTLPTYNRFRVPAVAHTGHAYVAHCAWSISRPQARPSRQVVVSAVTNCARDMMDQTPPESAMRLDPES